VCGERKKRRPGDGVRKGRGGGKANEVVMKRRKMAGVLGRKGEDFPGRGVTCG